MGIAPYIATLCIPMGKGHPIDDVDTTRDIMSAFRYFNSFGGNPVSRAAVSTMLGLLHNEPRVEYARDNNEYA